MSEKIIIPPEVTDKRAYMLYIGLGKTELAKHPYYEMSDGNIISLKTFPSKLKQKIAHLSPAEQETILELKSKYTKMIGRRGLYKAQAFRQTEGYKIERTRKQAIESDCIELLGKLFTPAETVQILGEEYGVSVAEEKVVAILKKHLPEVERRREQFRNKIQDVRLYSKRSRLEELGWMYSKMKQRYILVQSEASYGAMLRTLEQIRKEAEGDTLTINAAIDVSVEVEVQAHIQREIYKTINLKEIILGRVAARMGYDVTKLIAGLHNSYYSKFVQMSGNFDSNAQMIYPSTDQYDFTEIEKRVNVDEVEDVKAEEVTEPQRQAAQTTQEIFLAKIREQRARQEERLNKVDAVAESKRIKGGDDMSINRPKVRHKDKKIIGGSKTAKERK